MNLISSNFRFFLEGRTDKTVQHLKTIIWPSIHNILQIFVIVIGRQWDSLPHAVLGGKSYPKSNGCLKTEHDALLRRVGSEQLECCDEVFY